jgi:hypothetical protein
MLLLLYFQAQNSHTYNERCDAVPLRLLELDKMVVCPISIEATVGAALAQHFSKILQEALVECCESPFIPR